MPENRTPLSKEFLSLGPRRALITGYLKNWFAAHFSDAFLIEHPELRSKLWHKETNVGSEPIKIQVEDLTRWKPSQTESRPSILVSAGAWQVQRWGIGDKMQGNADPTGRRYFACGAAGMHTIFGLSTLPWEAELLGAEIYQDLLQFGWLIREELCLHRWQVGQWGQTFQVKEARQNYASPVTVLYVAQEQWIAHPHAPFGGKLTIQNFGS